MAPTRSAAQRLISAGQVSANGVLVAKAGTQFTQDTQLTVQDSAEIRFVSRSGLKLEAAMATFKLDCNGMVCLDVGQSTGGFSECLLNRGALRVVGVDVGHGQLADSLKGRSDLICLERVNARNLSAEQLLEHYPASGFDFVAMDVSFISSRLVWPTIRALAKPNSSAVWLVKPQFELGREAIGKSGLVAVEWSVDEWMQSSSDELLESGWSIEQWIASPISGGDGNKEYLALLKAV
jgi:23S rRNA (cytidine1920-2'-O)/16S rRNA (cytidine1409-2'-O)-methyltransferase